MKQPLRNLLHAPVSALRSAGKIGLITAGLSGLMLSAPIVLADISVHLAIEGPPAPRHEVIVERDRPGSDYVWVEGYWGGEPGRYVWVNGHWDRPPHSDARWMAPHWERDRDGRYYQVKGEWRDEGRHDDRQDSRHDDRQDNRHDDRQDRHVDSR